MFNHDVGLPDIEVRFVIQGDEAAVVAFFAMSSGVVEIIVGCDDPEYAPHIARTLEAAAQALRGANWKQVRLDGDGSVPFDLDVTEAGSDDAASGTGGFGSASSETQFPF